MLFPPTRRNSNAAFLLSLAGSVCAVGVTAHADEPSLPAPFPSFTAALAVDSGALSATGSPDKYEVLYTTVVSVPGAEWVRLAFGDCTLAGDPGADGALIRLTSAHDGHSQLLNAESLQWWNNTSAYFNGSEVLVEVLSRKGAGESRITITSATGGLPPQTTYADRTICGTTDDRQLSNLPGNARLMTVGCTAWMINDVNHQFLTAGHCGVTTTSVVQFNVPLSTSTGTIQNPPPQDQFPVDFTSNQGLGGGVGNDWRYFGALPNSGTGITAFQHQNGFYTLANVAPPVAGQTIRITGYGTVASPVSQTWRQVQKTHVGNYFSLTGTTVRYTTDTTGGNSGSPVLNVNTGEAIGIHTHGGCSSTGGSNSGTAVQHAGLQAALNSPLGICRSGLAPATGTLLAAGDLNNNLGTLGTTVATFGKLALIPRTFQGLAADHSTATVWGVDSTRRLHALDEEGTLSDQGLITGTTLTFTGLGFDSNTGTLYAITGANGQLFTINTATRVATAVGATGGGLVGALEFDHTRNTLFGLDDGGTGTRLVTINTTTGAQTVIGTGIGATDCNGLAYDPATDALYTVNSPTGVLIRINPTTGAGTPVGPTGAMFGASLGLTAIPVPIPTCSADFNGDGDVGTDADIEAFFACLAGACCATCSPSGADFNNDGDFGTDADIEAFFRVLAGGIC